jgi:bifunctional DNA-binding transcriptional regulator/antitoxin component of YhaV-PrlF toxin-antitoxin module
LILQNTVKVQQTKSNVTLNIPKEQREVLEICGGDTLLLTANTETNEIIIKKVGV